MEGDVLQTSGSRELGGQIPANFVVCHVDIGESVQRRPEVAIERQLARKTEPLDIDTSNGTCGATSDVFPRACVACRVPCGREYTVVIDGSTE